MKKVLSALVLSSLLVTPMVALAVCPNPANPTAADKCTDCTSAPACNNAGCMWNPATGQCFGTSITSPKGLVDLINTIGNWIFAALLALAIIFLLVAAFFFVTAGGNTESINKARQMLIYALIGVAIAVGAKALVAIILGLIS